LNIAKSIVLKLTVLLCLGSFSLPAFGTVFFVSTNGNDSYTGTEQQPWRTIQKAAETMTAGDSVLIRAGIYYENVYTIRDGDDSEGPIVFACYPNEGPVIDGTGVTSGSTGFRISHSCIQLAGLEIRNWDTGIWITTCGHIQISDCEVHEVWYGIGATDGAHDFELNRVEIYRFTGYGFDASPWEGNDCYNGTLNDCISHTSRDPEQNVDGFALGHGTQYGFVLNRCETYDVYDGFDISARNTVLNRCSAHECAWGGYKIWQDSVKLVNCLGYNNDVVNVEVDDSGTPHLAILQNSTFFNGHVYNIAVENPQDKLRITNCILAGGDNVGLLHDVHPENYQGDYNLFHIDNPPRMISAGEQEFSLDQIASGEWTAYSGQDSHSVVVYHDSSLFSSPEDFNLHLLSSASAIDHGTPISAPLEDYDGLPRPSGIGFDIGAYEYQFQTNVYEDRNVLRPAGISLLQNYPNPFNPFTEISYSLCKTGNVMLIVYDVTGREIATLINQIQSSGNHRVIFDGSDLPSGVYFYNLETGQNVIVKKMVLIK